MNSNQKELVKYRLERSKETLEQAKIMFDTKHPTGVINRLYYACFYAVSALLLCYSKSSAKHSGVLGLFNKDFIKNGIFPHEMGKFYTNLFASRQDADYADMVEVEENQVKELLSQSEIFIADISKHVWQKL